MALKKLGMGSGVRVGRRAIEWSGLDDRPTSSQCTSASRTAYYRLAAVSETVESWQAVTMVILS